MKHRVSQVGSVGLVTDVQSEDLPDNAWSTAINVRCERGYIRTFPGSTEIFDPTGDARYLIPLPTPSANYLIYPTDSDDDKDVDQIRRYESGASDTDISSGAYTASTEPWSGCVIHGIAVICNYGNTPEYSAEGATCTALPYTSTVSRILLTGSLGFWQQRLELTTIAARPSVFRCYRRPGVAPSAT